VTPRTPDELRREIESEQARLEEATRRLRAGAGGLALPRRLPWALALGAFLAGLGVGRRLPRRRG